MTNKIYLELFYQQKWHDYASISIKNPHQSTSSPSSFDYNLEFVFDHFEFENAKGFLSASLLLPLGMNNTQLHHWPSFLLDLMRQGAARKTLCRKENIFDLPENDFQILLKGSCNPIGNIRIKNEEKLFSGEKFNGLSYKDILALNEEFIDYAIEMGAIVAGGSGAQGMALKFLLNTDHQGRFHFDGALKDNEVKESFIVKFPRGKTEIDSLILKTEKTYMDIASLLGLRVHLPLHFEKNILFTRNTAFLKLNENKAILSPLFDFAPMVLDEEMIVRSSRWKEESSSIPHFPYLYSLLEEKGFTKKELNVFFKDWETKIKTIPKLLKKCRWDSDIQKKATKKLSPFKETLCSFLGKIKC